MLHFRYCPLAWMFHDRKSYIKINKIHERALRIIHNNSTSNFEELLIKSNSIKNLNPSFIGAAFVTDVVPCSLCGSTNFVLPKARTNLYGINTIRFVAQKLWQNLPKEIRVPNIGDF